MADKLACTYRYVKKDGDELSRVILRAGDDVPKDLSKEEKEDLKKAGLIVDEKRLSKDNLRLPFGHPDSGEEEPEETETEQAKANAEPEPQAAKASGSKDK